MVPDADVGAAFAPGLRVGWPRCAAARLSFPVRSGRRRTSNVAAVSARGILPYGGLVCCGRLPAVPEYRMMRGPRHRAGTVQAAARSQGECRLMVVWGIGADMLLGSLRQPPGGPLRKDLGIRIRGMEFRLFSADRCGAMQPHEGRKERQQAEHMFTRVVQEDRYYGDKSSEYFRICKKRCRSCSFIHMEKAAGISPAAMLSIALPIYFCRK